MVQLDNSSRRYLASGGVTASDEPVLRCLLCRISALAQLHLLRSASNGAFVPPPPPPCAAHTERRFIYRHLMKSSFSPPRWEDGVRRRGPACRHKSSAAPGGQPVCSSMSSCRFPHSDPVNGLRHVSARAGGGSVSDVFSTLGSGSCSEPRRHFIQL